MLKALSPAAALLAVLALAGPAAAQDPSAPADTTPAPVCSGAGENDPGTCTSGSDQTIGQGQVITDPAGQVDGPTAPDDGDRPAAQPKKGEQHVLGDSASASSPKTSSAPTRASAPAPATTPQPVADAGATAKTLPFTGVDARPLVLLGVLLLGSGLLLRRRLEA